MEINLKEGDKIITYDGRKGYILSVHNNHIAMILYEDDNPYDTKLDITDEEQLSHFYLIGKTVLGNKISERELQGHINIQKHICEKHSQKLAQLRKQMFVLREQMRPDWRERAEELHKQAEQRKKQSQANKTRANSSDKPTSD